MTKINHESGNKGAWICLCGNTPSGDGFYTCNCMGMEVEPDKHWNGHLYVCGQCARIIDQYTLEVVSDANSKIKVKQ